MYKWVGTVLTGTLCGWKMNETGSILPPEELLDCWLAVAQLGRDILLAFLWSLILLYTSAVVIKTVRLPVVATTVCQPVKSWHHDFRWLSALGLVVIHVAEVGEILLLDQNVPVLELCLPACNALVVLLSCVFFDRIEIWRRRSYLLWICPYWIAETAINLIRWIGLGGTYVTLDGSLAVRSILIWIKICLALFLLLCDASGAFFFLQEPSEENGTTSRTKVVSNPSESEEANKITSLTQSNHTNESVDSVFINTTHPSDVSSQPSRQCCYLHDQSNLPSRATFFWLNPLLLAGYRTPLEQKDLGPLPDGHKSSSLGQKIRKLVEGGDGKTSLWRCYWTFSWPAILLGGFLKFTGDLVGYVAPLGIQVLVSYINSSVSVTPDDTRDSPGSGKGQLYYPNLESFLSNGYIMAGIVFLSSFLQGTLSQSSSHVLCVEGIRLKTALQSYAYDKSLRLSSLLSHESAASSEASNTSEAASNNKEAADEAPAGRGMLDAGTFSQLLTEDCGNVMVLLCLGHYLWAIPLKLAILLYLLHQKLGVGSVIAALLCLLIMVPAQFLLGSRISLTNKLSMKEADRRLAKILEWLSNMKLFRLYAWERVGMSRIQAVRQRELDHLWSYSLQWAWATFLTQASTVALTLLSFVLYPLFSSPDASSPPAGQALSGLALINQFTVPLTIIPVIVPDLIAACNSTIRLQEFFRQPEVDNQRRVHAAPPPPPAAPATGRIARALLDKITEDSAEEHSGTESITDDQSGKMPDRDEFLVKIARATFSWHPEVGGNNGDSSGPFKLTDIDLDIRRGRLTVIVGPVGSGKSTLLMALLGELDLHSGSITWSSGSSHVSSSGAIHQHQVGYVAQKPWLMAASMRDNVLFGSPLKPKRYGKVLDACALTSDLDGWDRRDSTPIGSRGQNVSGGQRARIALARAIYSSASTVLLDDPFAALDPPVAQHVFRQAIQRILLRQGRSVIMATHQLEYAQMADHLVVMEAGRILVQGTSDEVASAWPELTQQVPADGKDPSTSTRAKDRWNMIRLVTKTGNVFKSAVSHRDLEESASCLHPDDSTGEEQQKNQRWKRRSSRLNALSIHMSHDLPLLTDEMVIEDEALPDRYLLSRDRSFTSTSRSVRKRHLSSQNGPLPEALPSAAPQPRSVSFSIKGGRIGQASGSGASPYTSAISFFLMRRGRRRRSSSSSRDRYSSSLQQQVSLHPLAGNEDDPSSASLHSQSADASAMTTTETGSIKLSLRRLWSNPLATVSLGGNNRNQNSSVASDLVDQQPSGGTRRTSSSSIGSSHRRRSQSGLHRLISTVSGFSEDASIHQQGGIDDSDSSDPERGLLVDPAAADEERQYGRVPRRLYWLYARSCGLWLTMAYFLGSFGWQAARIATDYWLVAKQIEAQQPNSAMESASLDSLVTESTDRDEAGYNYLGIYTLLSVISVVAALLTNILGQAAGSHGRKRLHEDLLSSLSSCHTRLFDLEPTGRLLNRFNSDMAMIDKKLATTFQRLVQFVLMCLSAIVVNVFISRWSLVIALVIVAVFYVLQRFFRTSARELQRLESLTKGPVVSHLTETLSGLSTLRAFGQQRRFLATMYEHIDDHTAAVLVLNTTNRWLGFALDSLGAAAVLVAMVLSLLVHRHHSNDQTITAGQVGLAVNYTLMTPIYLQWVVRFWSELEMYFNAVERVLHYSHLLPEGSNNFTDPTSVGSSSLPPPVVVQQEGWPKKGEMEISHLFVLYHPQQEPPVIRDLNLSIRHGEKVGICGRTGSGKSTLVNAIFRLADAAAGSIQLDGIDVSCLEPHYLRSRLALVPQDTLITAGTLRDNLDPEHKIPDEKLYSVLEAVHLKDATRSCGLDGDLWKSGSCSLSVGQQQLLSIARAALRPSPFLILDEPSSALDADAEQTLHHCLDHLFRDRTVVLISHRVSSLRRCDRLCLMEDGRIMMQGTPDYVLSQLPIDE